MKPQCKCGNVCQYYGEIGGYSVQCETCNEKRNAEKRASRAKNGAVDPQRSRAGKLGGAARARSISANSRLMRLVHASRQHDFTYSLLEAERELNDRLDMENTELKKENARLESDNVELLQRIDALERLRIFETPPQQQHHESPPHPEHEREYRCENVPTVSEVIPSVMAPGS